RQSRPSDLGSAVLQCAERKDLAGLCSSSFASSPNHWASAPGFLLEALDGKPRTTVANTARPDRQRICPPVHRKHCPTLLGQSPNVARAHHGYKPPPR